MKPSLVAAALVALVSLSLLIPVLAAPPDGLPSPAYTVRGPIFIEGNTGFTSANGVVSGSGTPADPYVISGWSINASAANGIDIENTTASFVIRGVEVHWGSPSGYDGVHLVAVSDAAIESSSLSNNSAGIRILGGSNVAVSDCNLTWNRLYGLQSTGTVSLSIVGSRVTYASRTFAPTGIDLFQTSRSSVQGNTVLNAWMGMRIYFDSNTTVESNTLNVAAYGVVTNSSINLKILDNDLTGTSPDYYPGVTTWGQDTGVVLAGNNITQFTYGLYLQEASNVSVQGNNISYSRAAAVYGIALPPLLMIGNVLWHNPIGVYGAGAVAYHNAFVDNTQQVAAFGASIWDDGYPVGGNYWSDYAGVDQCNGPAQNVCTGPDGIGDTPYVIDANNSDPYPLMVMGGSIDYPPAAMFTLTSSSPYAPATVFADASGSWDWETSGSVLQVRWDWNGDGVWDTGWSATKTAQHTFTSPGPVNGTYTIHMEVIDGAGLTANATHTVQILAPPPAPVAVTIAAHPTSGALPLTVSFASTVSGGVPPYSYDWTFGDGSTSTLANTVHIYVTGGNFTVWCNVADSASGGAGSNFLYVNVTPTAVNLSVTAPTQFVATSDGIVAPFSSSVTGGTPPYNYTWDFGDGSRSYFASPVHTYANPGAYTVTLTVRDSVGRTATQQFTVIVPAFTGGPPASYTILYVAIGFPTAIAAVFGILWLRERRKARPPPTAP